MPSSDLVVGLVILLVLLAFFVRVEATRLVMNPIRSSIPFKYYLIATVTVLEHTLLLVITIPLAIGRKIRDFRR